MASHGLKVASSRRNIETMPRPPSSKMPCKIISKTSRASSSKMNSIFRWVAAQRKVFTTPLLSEAKSHRNVHQFTKKNSRCQRGGVRGVANQNATTERTNQQTRRCSKDEAAALRKNHVGRLKRRRRVCHSNRSPPRETEPCRLRLPCQLANQLPLDQLGERGQQSNPRFGGR